ncbi:MAG TPA: hypothetical protein VII12_19390 [Thermoanaerobaculia bacterium]|jgi:hypothetical protein
MRSKPALIAFAAVIGFAAGLLIASAEWLSLSSPYHGYGLLFSGLVRPIAIPLLWPARLLVPSAPGSPIATSLAIVANGLLYAAAAFVADRIYIRRV